MIKSRLCDPSRWLLCACLGAAGCATSTELAALRSEVRAAKTSLTAEQNRRRQMEQRQSQRNQDLESEFREVWSNLCREEVRSFLQDVASRCDSVPSGSPGSGCDNAKLISAALRTALGADGRFLTLMYSQRHVVLYPVAGKSGDKGKYTINNARRIEQLQQRITHAPLLHGTQILVVSRGVVDKKNGSYPGLERGNAVVSLLNEQLTENLRGWLRARGTSEAELDKKMDDYKPDKRVVHYLYDFPVTVKELSRSTDRPIPGEADISQSVWVFRVEC